MTHSYYKYHVINQDTATNKELEIVKDSCYAGTIGAEPLGAAAGTVANSKVVGQFSQFK